MVDFNITPPHPSFAPFFAQEQERLLTSLRKIQGDPLPLPLSSVFRYASQDLSSVRVVIFGMDPYPQVGVATGRAFEVGGYESWQTPLRNASLNNILKLMYRTYRHEYASIQHIRNAISTGAFPILPPPSWFNSLERQGVLFLNIFPTVSTGSPQSHGDVWSWYGSALIGHISSYNRNISWFMFGTQVQRYTQYISHSHGIFECDHPSRINIHKPSSFINSPCFHETRNIINWLG